jgi:hypothetical protein
MGDYAEEVTMESGEGYTSSGQLELLILNGSDCYTMKSFHLPKEER